MAGTMSLCFLAFDSSSSVYILCKNFFPSLLKIVSKVYSFTENKPYETQSFCSKKRRHWKSFNENISRKIMFFFFNIL